MRISLTVTAGPHAGQVFTFEGHDTFIVGRSKRAHFRLPHKDKYFSRVHFMVEVNPPHCRLMDMGSTNHTYVNGQQVKMIDLKPGDEIRAGKTVLRLDVVGTAEIEAAPPFPADAAPREVAGSVPAPGAEQPASEPVVVEAPAAESVAPLGGQETVPEQEPEPMEPAVPKPPTILGGGTMVGLLAPPPSGEPAPASPEPPAANEPPPLPRFAGPSEHSMATLRPTVDPPFLPVGDLGGAPRPALLPREPCLVCQMPIPPQATPLTSAATGKPLPICGVCWDQARNQHQPIEGFVILKKLGHGGMGVVQLAVRTVDNTLVALKTIIPSVAGSQTKVDRFLREADILRTLKHPNIVSFRDMGSSNGTLYFAMDYVPGTDAAHLLRHNGGPLPIPRAVNLICQLLDALDYAHGKGFVHRDIKPANLMVTHVDGRETIKLADFGLARVYQASELSGLTMMGDMGGTLAFMAPEQITNFREAKPAADLYAAAATLYNLITEKFVHDLPKPAEQRLLMILTEDVVHIHNRRRDIPEGLAAVIHRALIKNPPDLRFPDAKTMRQALLPYAR
jgi:serine/threonine-protein kinase